MFVGREGELESFKALWSKKGASLVACRGRRRIGKSTFVEEFARRSGAAFVNIDGLPPRPGMTNADQLANFAVKLAAQTGAQERPPSGWFDAFRRLDGAIDDRRKTVVLLDEISWMGKYDPDFPGYLKSAWDTALKKHPRLVLVVCGVPRYLEEVDPSRSAAENIRDLCFRPDGTLFRDFRQIFNDVFGENAGVKRELLRALSAGPRTCSELAEALGVERGGSISENLSVLELSGFVAKDAGLNPRPREGAAGEHEPLHRRGRRRVRLRPRQPARRALPQGGRDDDARLAPRTPRNAG